MKSPLTRSYLAGIVGRPLFLGSALFFAVAALYGQFLGNPLVFDDARTFSIVARFDGWLPPTALDLRWVTNASLAWTQKLFGSGLFAFRIGNLVIHGANAVLLFLFLRHLFELSLQPKPGQPPPNLVWLAFFCALTFALHPVAVYATAYLIQRSTLLATLFVFLMWTSYLRGLVRQHQGWLLSSVLFYYLAVFSKEHSVAAPAVAVCLTLLTNRPSLPLLKMLLPTFFLYAAIAAVLVVKSSAILGAIYEPQAAGMLSGAAPEGTFLLSAINQSFLFFKYLLLWVLPHPGRMSVDIREPFPSDLLSFPQVAGPPMFLLFIATAGFLMLGRRDKSTRLAGFGLLAPALMFMTEFSTVRVQEPFVLYRSYLWFGALFAIAPVLVIRSDVKKTFVAFVLTSVVLALIAWNRLTTFSDPLLLWDDAARLVNQQTSAAAGADRIFYNRGNALLARKRFDEALDDYARVIRLNPSHAGAYNNRGTIHYEAGRYAEALEDFKSAVASSPGSRRPYFGLGMSYVALGDTEAAKKSFRHSCDMHFQPACARLSLLERR